MLQAEEYLYDHKLWLQTFIVRATDYINEILYFGFILFLLRD
jgi:hypothetical protein